MIWLKLKEMKKMNEEWLIGFIIYKKKWGGGVSCTRLDSETERKDQVRSSTYYSNKHGWLHLSVSLCLTPRLACLFFISLTVNLFQTSYNLKVIVFF